MSDEPAAIADYFDEWADSVDPLWQGGFCSDNEALRERSENARTAARMLRQLDMLRTAIGDPDELRWHRWHCEETGQGDDLRELLVRIADAADVAVAEGAEDRVELDAPPEPAPTADGTLVSHPIDETDEANVALANPAYGYRISRDYVDAERAAMSGDDGKFGRERLGVWDPLPETAAAKPAKLPADKWAATVTDTPPVELTPGELALAFDVSRDGAWSTIAVAAGTVRSSYVEVIEHAEGVGWLPDRWRFVRPVNTACSWNPEQSRWTRCKENQQ